MGFVFVVVVSTGHKWSHTATKPRFFFKGNRVGPIDQRPRVWGTSIRFHNIFQGRLASICFDNIFQGLLAKIG